MPDALIQVLSDLHEENAESSVVTIRGSYAEIFVTATSAPLILSRFDCERVLNTPDTVEMLFEALGEPTDAAITLHHVTIDDKVQDALERNFKAVDED